MLKISNLILFVFSFNYLISQKELCILPSDNIVSLDETTLFVEKKDCVFIDEIVTKIDYHKYALNIIGLSQLDTLFFHLKTTKYDYLFNVPISKLNSYEVYYLKLVSVGRRFLIKQYNIQLLNNRNEIITPFYAKRKRLSCFYSNVTKTRICN
jgi:hypothetical protein